MKSETHRPGDNPNFDERANEDSYFSVREHELIEDMKQEFRKEETGRRVAQTAICPKCSGQFAKYRFMGFDLERCKDCEGIWLNKGDLQGILRQQARGPLGRFLDRCFFKVKNGNESR